MQQVLTQLRDEEDAPSLAYTSVYLAVQLENQRLIELGENPKFVTSRDGNRRAASHLEFRDHAPDRLCGRAFTVGRGSPLLLVTQGAGRD